jgi:hypothetical protein
MPGIALRKFQARSYTIRKLLKAKLHEIRQIVRSPCSGIVMRVRYIAHHGTIHQHSTRAIRPCMAGVAGP